MKKAQYIEAPSGQKPKHEYSIFLAGGITNCPDWQQEAAKKLSSLPVTIYNPRRVAFPIGDPGAAQEQIEWEHKRLHEADIVLYWFARGSLNPIVLFELGAALERRQSIVVGCDPEYERKQDVEIQVRLMRPDLQIRQDLTELVSDAQKCLKKLQFQKEERDKRTVALRELPERLKQFSGSYAVRMDSFNERLIDRVRGDIFDIALVRRSTGKDTHICFEIFAEDDGVIHQTDCRASTAWIEDLISTLNKTKAWLSKCAVPDGHERHGYRLKK